MVHPVWLFVFQLSLLLSEKPDQNRLDVKLAEEWFVPTRDPIFAHTFSRISYNYKRDY